MLDTQLRKLTVDNKPYLWRIRNYYDGVEGKLNIYSAKHKAGGLFITFAEKEYYRYFPDDAVYKWTGEIGISIHAPVTTVRIIRYATRQLNWMPDKNKVSLVIENGYSLMMDLGYEAVTKE